MPVAGPATTVPPPGTPPPPPTPPPNPTLVLTQVQADLSQLSAIQAYGQAKAEVASSQQGVAAAEAALRTATTTQAQAGSVQLSAQAQVSRATDRLRHLAVAAYMGVGNVTSASAPRQAGGGGTVASPSHPDGTVASPSDPDGTVAADAQELLRLVAERDRENLTASQHSFQLAKRSAGTAGQGVGQARGEVASAEAALTASQQTLALVTRAATTPGLAAALNLFNLPGGQVSTAAAKIGSEAVTGQAVEATAAAPVAASPTILGPSVLTGAEMAQWFAGTGRKANTTVSMPQLAQDYQQAGQQTGVRDDLAFAQSIVETGFFSFPTYGQLTPKDNNFAGIGACDSCAHGWSFPTAQIGVTAQLELLEAYASPTPVSTPLLGPVGVGGCCPTWIALAGKWASSLVYGISIMTIYHQMLGWLIPQRLVAAGLLAPPKPAPAKVAPTHR